MEGLKPKGRSSGVIGIIIAVGVVLELMTAGAAAGLTISEVRKNTGETPQSTNCYGIPDGGNESIHENIITTTFGGCGKNGGCADPQDNCRGSGGISTGCSAPTKMYAALPLSKVPAQCSGNIANCSRIQVINPKTNKSAVLAVVDTGPWNIDDSEYVMGTARPQAETGTDKRGRETNKAGLDISHEAYDLVGEGNLNWKFTSLPLSDGTASSGGCTSTTNVNNGMVMLDPGHGVGGEDGCGRGYIGGEECKNDFLVAQQVKTILESKGVKVAFTKNTADENPLLPSRRSMTNALGASLFVSIHSNSNGESGPIGIVFCHHPLVKDNGVVEYDSDSNCPKLDITDKSKTLSRNIVGNIKSAYGFSKAEYWGSDLGVLDGLTMPAVLIEMFFHDNSNDIAKYNADKSKMAPAIANGILKYMGK